MNLFSHTTQIALVTSSALSFNAAERDDDAPYRAIKQYGQCFIDAFTDATANTDMAYGAVELILAYHQAIAEIETCQHATEPDEYALHSCFRLVFFYTFWLYLPSFCFCSGNICYSCFAEKVLDKLAAFALWTETFPVRWLS